ncbi:hypothetical protein N824_01780 [Pedobacter sp. V48]|nr:hypothetical protein N824_01780 [Pedobacter sp. V48]
MPKQFQPQSAAYFAEKMKKFQLKCQKFIITKGKTLAP